MTIDVYTHYDLRMRFGSLKWRSYIYLINYCEWKPWTDEDLHINLHRAHSSHKQHSSAQILMLWCQRLIVTPWQDICCIRKKTSLIHSPILPPTPHPIPPPYWNIVVGFQAPQEEFSLPSLFLEGETVEIPKWGSRQMTEVCWWAPWLLQPAPWSNGPNWPCGWADPGLR